jgi:multidrug transporter EmrE-like cation transporter
MKTVTVIFLIGAFLAVLDSCAQIFIRKFRDSSKNLHFIVGLFLYAALAMTLLHAYKIDNGKWFTTVNLFWIALSIIIVSAAGCIIYQEKVTPKMILAIVLAVSAVVVKASV